MKTVKAMIVQEWLIRYFAMTSHTNTDNIHKPQRGKRLKLKAKQKQQKLPAGKIKIN